MSPRITSIAIFLFLPIVMLFDVFLFFWTKTGCLQPGCISEFVRSSSVSAALAAEGMRNWRGAMIAEKNQTG